MNGFVPKLKTGVPPNENGDLVVVELFGVVDVALVVVVVEGVELLSLLSVVVFAGSLGEAALSNKLGPPEEGKEDSGGKECSVLEFSFGASS